MYRTIFSFSIPFYLMEDVLKVVIHYIITYTFYNYGCLNIIKS